MIDTKALRNKILDLAISGKLTEQLPEDGNAEDLYAQIQEEKARLIAEGKIKKEKPLPPINEDEIPFEIPENWEWVRLGNYCQKVTDQVASGSFASLRENVNSLKTKDYALMVKTADFANGFTENLTYTDKHGYEFLNNSNLFGGELILSNIGSIGKCFIVPKLEIKMTLAPNSIMLKLTSDELRDYLYYFLLSSQGFMELEGISTGVAVKKFNKTDLKGILIPIPPLAEQKRIVSAVEDAFAVIDRIEKAQESYYADQEVLKNKIIDAGIRGKLTEQLPEDGNAEDLYALIQEEKARLIAEGKIKKEKPLPPINEDEIPFDIPENWKWVRLGDISTYGKKNEKMQPCNMLPEQWLLELEDIEAGGRLLQKTSVKERIPKGEKVVFAKGNILYSKLRPYLKKVLIADDDGIATPEIIPFKSYAGTEHGYLKECLVSTYFDKTVNQRSFGVKMPRVDTEFMRNMLIPLPPLEEQKRIVEKIDSIFNYL